MCDCGSRNLSKRYVLLAGNKKSCGCLKRDRLSELAKSQNRQARLRAGIPEDENIYERQPIPGLARLIKIRDDFTCALCKIRGVKLVTHHIISWFMNRELHGEPSNLVTLCDVCHKTKAHRGGFKIPPDPVIAEILKKHVEGLPLGGALEKHGTLELTEEEQLLILSGVIPERIKRNWDDLSLSELQQTVNRLRNKG
jgi:5-methylcytosine-specific restriction endonuclease McrA